MADEIQRPTGKRQLTGASTTSADAYAERRLAPEGDDNNSQESLGTRIKSYLPEVIEQMKKVIWPTGKQMLNYTLIVFLFLIVMTVVVWGTDVLTAEGVQWVLTP